MKDKFKLDSVKLYHPNSLSLTQNNDHSHQKIWSQKVEEAKHIQEQKKIDKMFQCLIKERLFGNFLSEDSRISTEGYFTIDKINKHCTNPPKLGNSRKIVPLKNQPAFSSRITEKKSKYSTIDVPDRSHNISRESAFSSREGVKNQKPQFES